MDIKVFLHNLTTEPGVYQMLGDDERILYIGKASNLKKRLTSYFSAKQQDTKTIALLKHVKDIHVTITHSENDALLLECNLIKKHKPHYNVLFRDDKSYPYIFISEDAPYPYIDLYRGHKKTNGKYFGPYPSVVAVRETIYLIQKLFGLRLSSDRYYPGRTRPCLQYQIGLCSGSCAGFISKEEYAKDVELAVLFLQGKNQEILKELHNQMEQAAAKLQYELAAKLRNQIAKLREIQAKHYVSTAHGEADVLGFSALGGLSCVQLLIIRNGRILGSRAYFPDAPLQATAEEIVISFIEQHYLSENKNSDDIPKEIILSLSLSERSWLMKALSFKKQHKVMLSHLLRGDRKKWLEIANASAKQSITSRIFDKINMQQRFSALQKLFQWKCSPKRIECFDISHSMGEATVGACVVFDLNGAVKSDYRRFNITGITPGDDIAAMRQTLLRRYKRLQNEPTKCPDIILIDGGLTQLTAAEEVLSELLIDTIQLIAVAKGVTRKPGFETLYLPGKKPIHLDTDSLALHLIQQIRDEAHRFAITGHRQRRDKKRNISSLEMIPGIGAKRRRELLRYFGGIQALNRASLEELARVPGISQSLAHRIYAALHES
jgi:excinuclease ABC subunit C